MGSNNNYIQIKKEPPSIEQGWVPAHEGKFYFKVMERMAENFIRMGFDVYVQLMEDTEKISDSMTEMDYKFFLRGKYTPDNF
jgi:hypothetical protein